MIPDNLQIMQNRDNHPAFTMPALDKIEQISRGARVDRGERLVEQQDFGILQQHSGK